MRMPRFHEARLTGHARARPGWFGRQVLQVEVATLSYSACPPMPGSDRKEWEAKMKEAGETTYSWRDASWADIAFLVACGTLEPRRDLQFEDHPASEHRPA